MTDVLLVGFDLTQEGKKPVLIVGRSVLGKGNDIIKVFQGEEALSLYNKLIGKEKKYA